MRVHNGFPSSMLIHRPDDFGGSDGDRISSSLFHVTGGGVAAYVKRISGGEDIPTVYITSAFLYRQTFS